MRKRLTPYTAIGIKRLKCFRCSMPAKFQWQICSDDNIYRPICEKCDIALNRLVLRWMGFADWKEKLKRYANRITGRK